MLIDSIDSGLGMADFKITLLHALKMARTARDKVTLAGISNRFRIGGFVYQFDQSESSSEQNEIEQDSEEMSIAAECLSNSCTFEEYTTAFMTPCAHHLH